MFQTTTEEVHTERKVETKTKQALVTEKEQALGIALLDGVPFKVHCHEVIIEVSLIVPCELMFSAAGAYRPVDYELDKLADIGHGGITNIPTSDGPPFT